MPRLRITGSRKARGGKRILGLWGPTSGYRDAEEVVRHIRKGSARYFVREGSWEADIRVVEKDEGAMLVSTADLFSRNHLANLPDC